VWACVSVTALLISSCTNLVNGEPRMAHPDAVTVAPPTSGTAAPPQAPKIKWSQCDVGPLPKGAECGELAVPIDYGKAGGPEATIAVLRFGATGKKIGSLLFNPGGPGGSGVELAAGIVRALPDEIRRSFDIVGFDPRGVALSRPAVRCNSDAQNDEERTLPDVDYSPAGVAAIEQRTKDYVQRCVDKMGMDFLANVGTANVVKDLDALRIALGDNKLSYVGFSYGTEIGGAYAEAYPQNVRAMVLDGAVDPDIDPLESNLQQLEAFQKAFNDFAADCAKSPDCPLGTDPTKASDVYRSLVGPLVDTPAKTHDPRGLSYSDAITATIEAMYSPSSWGTLTSGLQDLASGEDPDDLLELADGYWQRGPDGSYNNLADANNAINCADEKYPSDPQAWADADKRAREVAPAFAYGDYTGKAPRDTCVFWPVSGKTAPHNLSAPGLAPVLVVSSTGDPATPYANGVNLAKQLNGVLLSVDGTQHTAAFQGNECVDDIVTKYLVDLTTPPPDTKC
jgi:pimeloyl-ACP methyl ester carboxylesterase